MIISLFAVFCGPLTVEFFGRCQERVQELETAAEAKENEYLMNLKVSKKTKFSKTVENSINSNSDVLAASNLSLKEQRKQISTPKYGKDLTVNNDSKSLQSLNIENSNATENKAVNFGRGSKTSLSFDEDGDCILIDEYASESTKALPEDPKHNCKDQDRDAVALGKPTLAKSEAASGIKRKTATQGKCNLADSSIIDLDIEMPNNYAGVMDEDVTLLTNFEEVQPMVNIRKESPFTASNSGMSLVEV